MTRPTLFTERFKLIPWQDNPDLNQHLRQMMQSEEVQRYIRGHAYSDDEVAESFAKMRQKTSDKFGMWLIFDGKICVGMCLLKDLPTEDDLGYFETGYWLKPEFWGKGIAGETAKRMVKYAFDELNLTCVVGVTHAENIASQKSLEKAGLKRQGNIKAYKLDLPFFKINNPNHSKTTQPTLQTGRFRLIPWRNHAAHNAQFTKLLKSEQVQKYISGKAHTDAEIDEGLPKMAERTNIQRGFGNWMIYDMGSNAEICAGIVFLKSTPLDEPYPYEIGYWLFPEFWGKGIAAEVADHIVAYGFEQLNLPHIVGITEIENIASQKSLMNIGFNRIESFTEEGLDIPQFKISNKNHKKPNKPVLQTKRFKLLPWVDCPEFKRHMTEMMQDAGVQKHIYEHLLSDEEMHSQLNRMTNVSAQPELGYWMIYQKDTCVGMALLKPYESKSDQYWAEVSYWLKPKFWGQAIATEVAAGLIKYGFEQVELDAIVAITHPDNFGSQKSLLNAGLHRQDAILYKSTSNPKGELIPFFKTTAADYKSSSSAS